MDAFTDRPFAGNPAAVVLDADGFPDELFQSVATEMNLSETAFPHAAGLDGVRVLRWFTPTTEVSLCGHATLAAAHALLEAGAAPPLRFLSRSGPLNVERDEDGRLRLDFPADPPAEGPPPHGLLDALGVPEGTRVRFAAGTRCSLLELVEQDAAFLASLDPDMRALGRVDLPDGVMGVSVTTRLGLPAPLDFASRFFGPWVGVDEDPVTGMAHCLLGPWWAARLGREPDGAGLEALQGGVRQGRLRVEMRGARVHLVGQAVTVAEGVLRVGRGQGVRSAPPA
ncbi:MAG: PhzF family phenazine biosynthesis protein [Gemmatimonadales bacterium]|nr:MAG: PhzF family phenazine biosynthesis protein [Gemmatimonadales bacterium]